MPLNWKLCTPMPDLKSSTVDPASLCTAAMPSMHGLSPSGPVLMLGGPKDGLKADLGQGQRGSLKATICNMSQARQQ